MRHRVKGRKLGRSPAHRKALFRNQLASLVKEERIRTTLHKAKELRPIAEKVVTQGKRDTVHARRQVNRLLPERDLVKKVFDDIAPRFQERPGGYTRIIKLGPRRGDGAEMALIEFVETGASEPEPEKKKGKKKKEKKEKKA
jgi:large subunit ribosomal protein L17